MKKKKIIKKKVAKKGKKVMPTEPMPYMGAKSKKGIWG